LLATAVKLIDEKKITTKIFDEIVRVSTTSGALPLFVYIPSGDEINDGNEWNWGEERLKEYCLSRNVLFLSTWPAI